MRPWRVRLAARRSRVQWALLAVVLLVSISSATLLGTLHLLSVATETFAARSALNDVPEPDVRVVHRVIPAPSANSNTVVTLSAAAASEHLGKVPYISRTHIESVLLAVPREDRPIALGYMTYTDTMEDAVELLDGAWPQTGSQPTEVIVPPRLLWDLDAEIGDTIELAPVNSRADAREVRIVGTWAVKDESATTWEYDRLSGDAHRPDVPVPFTGGRITTDGYGPLFTTAQGIGIFPTASVSVEYVPDFKAVSTADLLRFIEATEVAERDAQRTIAGDASDVTVTTVVDETLGRVVGSLAVTRSSVLVTGLLLLVLAIAALGQTARLMAERRHGEQHLMVARGSSVRQMAWLAFLEAIALGVLTTIIAAPLARQAYLWLSSAPVMRQAGMHRDPGLPAATWVVVGVVGLALVIVLVAPLLRRSSNFVDAEQAKSRPGRRAAFQRSGLDLAVVVLAALAYWQLRSYRSPVLDGGGVAQVDPLLAAGPALALLAGGLVAVRLIPAASKLFEGLASRGRKAVMPLASWEVARRSARAVSAVLLLSLAMSIGTFAMAFLASWQKSQQDQARFQHPADLVVHGVEEPALTQASLIDNEELGVVGSPVLDGATELSAVPESSRRNAFTDTFRGRAGWLTATDSDGLRTFGLDRLHEAGGSRIPGVLAHAPVAETNPIELPAEPQALRVTAAADISTGDVPDLVTYVSAVVRDSRQQYLTVPLGMIPADGKEYVLTGRIAEPEDLEHLSEPLYLVGIQARFIDFGDGPVSQPDGGTLGAAVELTLTELATVIPTQAIPVSGVPDVAEETPLDVPANLGWTPVGQGGAPVLEPEPQGDIYMRTLTTPTSLRLGGIGSSLTAAPAQGKVPLVASGPMLDRLGVDVGDEVIIKVNDSLLNAWIAQRLPRLPGDALRGFGVAANIEDLQLGIIQAGGKTVAPNEWWVQIDEADIPAYTASLPESAETTTRSGLARELSEDPLRIAIQAALWLVTVAAAVLAALGFGVHAVVTVRAREIEFAQLRAVGIQRGALLRIVSSESALLSVLGMVFGVGLGVALAYLVAPLVSVGPDGRAPIPPVDVVVPWATVGLLALEVVVVLVVTIAIVAVLLRRINPAQMLRLGDER
jgi:hypothetical protein